MTPPPPNTHTHAYLQLVLKKLLLSGYTWKGTERIGDDGPHVCEKLPLQSAGSLLVYSMELGAQPAPYSSCRKCYQERSYWQVEIKLVLWVVIGILVCGMVELSGDLSGFPLIWWKCKQCYVKSQMEKVLKAFWGMMETKQQIKTKHFFFRELHMETSGEAGNSLTRNKDFPQVWVLVLSLILTQRS